MIVGADCITVDGSVANKIGTYGMALVAYRHGIPFILVAPESTGGPATATGREIAVKQRAADEITHLGGVAIIPDDTAVVTLATSISPHLNW